MKTVTKLKVTRIIPLFDKRILMTHVEGSGLDRGWLGAVDLRCGGMSMRMRCVGVGETGTEPAIMLQPAESDDRAIQDILAALRNSPVCTMYVERVDDQRAQ